MFVLLSTAHAALNADATARIDSRRRVLFMMCSLMAPPSGRLQAWCAQTRNCECSTAKVKELHVFERLCPDRVQKPSQVIVECVVCASEGQIIPRNIGDVELSRFQTLVV